MAKTVTSEVANTGTKDMDSSVDFGPIETEQEQIADGHNPVTKIFLKQNTGTNSIDSFDASPTNFYSVFPL